MICLTKEYAAALLCDNNINVSKNFLFTCICKQVAQGATIAHLRVNKYSHWTKCFYVVFFLFCFFFVFFFTEDLIKIEDAGVATTVKN